MPLWDKVKSELDRAGRAAQDAIDEGKIRLEAFRARQQADRAAQALGYAVYRAKKAGGDIDAESYERLRVTLAQHEETAARLEDELDEIHARRGTRWRDEPPPAGAADTDMPPGAAAPEPPASAPGEGPAAAARPQTDVPPMT
jgi:hypothetical protein